MKKIYLAFVLLLLASKTFASLSFGTASADAVIALTNQHTTLTSTHFAFIYNPSSAVQNFAYSFQLCAQNNGCKINSFSTFLPPHQALNINWMIAYDVLYTTTGNYLVTATTSIIGPNTSVAATGTSHTDIILPFQTVNP